MYCSLGRGEPNYKLPFFYWASHCLVSLITCLICCTDNTRRMVIHFACYFNKRYKEKFFHRACKWLMMAHFGCREGICQNSSYSCMDWTGGQMKRIACAVSMETTNLMSGRLKMREIENDVIKSVYYINKQWHLLSFQQI